MKKQVIVFSLLICCLSCVSHKKEVIAKSTIKFEGSNTNIRDLIEIDGYYYVDTSNKKFGSIMFFEDGTWVYFHFYDDVPEDKRQTNMFQYLKKWNDGNQTRWGYYWGVYTIQNDTIIVHSYDKPEFLMPWGLSEHRYKIIDRKIIKPIYFRVRTDDDYYKLKSPWRKHEPIHFTPADSLPSSDCWLKEKKWIWRNEQDWKNYMERIKGTKK